MLYLSSLKPQRGLTLAEIAMAMFIIGIGVLSIATVYLQRERTASITAQQAIAHRLVTDMASLTTKQLNADVRFENAIGVRCATPLLNPTAQAEVVNEVACWQERVAAELPSGAGSIALDESTVPPNYAITVSWSQPRGGLASYTIRAAAHTASTLASESPPNATDSKPPGVRAAN